MQLFNEQGKRSKHEGPRHTNSYKNQISSFREQKKLKIVKVKIMSKKSTWVVYIQDQYHTENELKWRTVRQHSSQGILEARQQTKKEKKIR